MTKLEQTKEALLNGVTGRLLTSAKLEDILMLIQGYEILCQTELSAKALQSQVDGGMFKAHCHHDLPPNPFDEEIG